MKQPRSARILTRTLVVLVPVLTLAGGWLLALTFVSPAQVAANAQPQEAGPVWAPVTEEQLMRTAFVSGEVQPAESYEVDLSRFAGRSITGDGVEDGSELKPGSLLFEANGRPIFALPGDFPYYRDLALGMSGPDVLQLQRALNAQGSHLEEDGEFGPNTQLAVQRLYERLGYSAPTATESEDQVEEGAPDASAAGAVFVSDEIVVVPWGTRTVNFTLEQGGVVAPDARISLSTGGRHIIVDISMIGAVVDVGASAEIQLGGSYVPGTVIGVTRLSSSDGDEPVAAVIVEPVDPQSKEDYPESGSTVAVVLTVEDLGSVQLVVPTAAIAFDSQGGASVVKREKDGSRAIVLVDVIAEIAGRTAIEADSHMLEVGDYVMVGG